MTKKTVRFWGPDNDAVDVAYQDNGDGTYSPLASQDLPELTHGAVSMVKALDSNGVGSVELPNGTTIVGVSPNGTTSIKIGLEAPQVAVANTFKKGFIVYVTGSPTYFHVAKGAKTLYLLGANGQTVDILCANA